MISSKALILTVITVLFFMGGCAPEDGGKKVKTVSLYVNNETGLAIEKVFVASAGDSEWGTDQLALDFIGTGKFYINEIECNQLMDFRVVFFIGGEHKKYDYNVQCINSSLTWNIKSTTTSDFSIN